MPKKNYMEIPEDVWEKIKTEYITTDISMRGIEKKYGIPFSRLRARIENEGWKEAKDECKTKIAQKSLDLLADHKAEECTRAFRVASTILDKIEAIVANINEESPEALREIKSATSAIKDLKEIGLFRAELDRQEQMARINKLRKDAEEEQTDTNITVVIERGDEYAD